MATEGSALCGMPPPASLGDDRMTICESNAAIMTCNSSEAKHMVARTLAELPAVANGGSLGIETKSLKRKSTSGGNSGNSAAKTAKWAFLPPKQMTAGGPPAALAKLFWTMLSGEGLTQAVNELINCTSGNTADPAATDYQKLQSRAIHFSAKAFLATYNFVTLNIYGTLRPGITMSAEELTEKFHPTRDWCSSSVRCLAWHPHTNKVAVVMRDDAVHVYSAPNKKPYFDRTAPPFVPVLKYKQQRGVTTLAWRPFYASELAVGCSSGVLVWTIDPTSTVARPSAGSVSLLQAQGHSPVNHVEWQPNGELLLSVSTVDHSIILWNTASETGEVLRRVGILGNPGGFHLAQFSPDGRSLFAAHATTDVFRMWSTSSWTQESWRVIGGSVQTACWSRDSSTLLYTVTNDSKIFCIKFRPDVVTSYSDEDEVKTAGAAVPVVDLQEVRFTDDITGAEVTTGGQVQAMRWDSERLVISFVESNLLAIFQTEVSPSNIAVSPLGFVSGETDTEWPSCFEFAPHFSPQGALLTIAWTTGRVQHFPMYFTPSARHAKNILFDGSFAGHHHALTRQLSTSHLQDQSIGPATDFEPQLFSSPAT